MWCESLSFMIRLLLLLIFPWSLFTLLLIIAVASFGGTIGIREFYVEKLIQLFEWGAKISNDYEYDEPPDPSSTPTSGKRRRRSSGDLRIILREKSDLIDSELRSTEEPEHRKTTVRTVVDDSIDFITAGIEVIIEDQVTSRFRAEELPSWNLLTRTSYSFQHINWKLSVLWICGFLFRYLVLVPFRIVLFILGMSLMCFVSYIVGYISDKKIKNFFCRHVMLASMRIFSRSFSSIIRFHDRENRAKKGGICVANHTSPIDVMLLSCDNSYAMVGQKQGGILGFIQDSLSKSADHIWFERSEVGDRKKVLQRLREHVEDETKLPILIFPEGTCINNTSVMMFKKGSFEVANTIYPMAIKYDSRLTDAFWNSQQQSYGEYMWRMMTSWAIICDIWYLPPMTREAGEDAIAFARRVKRAIAKKGGLVDLEWDGQLKRAKVSSRLVQLQQKLYYDRLARTTSINDLEEEMNALSVMESMDEKERESLIDQIHEGDDDKEIIRKVSKYGVDLHKLSEFLKAAGDAEARKP
ncbi:unnamed protein product [Cylicocyclus nassatus]|uniref:Phospholipid/glycerol acyltransferase domain-containing protein n=1 Tax=Cylicocyclus nassatus TaxID=53992 RepID=A0AA36MGN4_CYLNA|nr:unnamed protein product [Cylicocyclus nassatus]